MSPPPLSALCLASLTFVTASALSAATLPRVCEPAAGLLAQVEDGAVEPWPVFDERFAGQKTEVTYGLDDGLPSLHIQALETGPDGRIWMGVGNELMTFDGVLFDSPHQRPKAQQEAGDSSGSPGAEGTDAEYVICMLRDSSDRLWTSTLMGAIRRYETGFYEDLPVEGRLGRVSCMLEANDGAIWAGGRGLVRITDDGIEQIFARDVDETPYVTAVATRTAVGTQPAPIWISTSEGLYCWRPTTGLEQLDDRRTLGVFFDASGRLVRILPESVEIDGQSVAWLSAEQSLDLEKAIWIDQDRTLAVLDGEALIIDFANGDPKVERFGELMSIDTALRGPDDTLWLGIGSGGLRRVDLLGFAEIPIPAPTQTLFVAKPAGTTGVAFASAFLPTFWVAKPTRGHLAGTPVAAFDWSNSALLSPMAQCFDLEVDAEGNGWMSCGAGVVFRSQGAARQVGADPGVGRIEGHLVSTPRGTVWAWDQLAMVEFQSGAPTGRTIPMDEGFVTQIIADGEDFLLFQEGQIVRCSTTELTQETLLELPGSMFGGLSLAANGDLWIPTDGNGLYRRRATGEVDQWTVAQGLPSNSVGWTGTVPGPTESTRVWMNSNAGVASITIESLNRTAEAGEGLLEFDLLPSSEPLGADGVALSSGILVLPTVKGPICIDTHKPLPQRSGPALSLGRIWADGREWSGSEELRGHTDLTFSYSAAQFPYRRTSVLQFRLEGHDSGWNTAGKDRMARYTGLPPGEYRFELRARAAGQPFGPTVTGNPITILRRWHQQPAIRLAALAALLCLSFFVNKLRTQRLRHHAAELEVEVKRRKGAEEYLQKLRQKEALHRRQLARAEEAERSRIARELHDDFSQRLAAVSMTLQSTAESLQDQIDPRGQAALSGSQEAIARLSRDVHALSRQLHPAVLDDLGLSAALRSECKRRGERTTANITLDDDGHGRDVRGDVGLALLRVAQEALQNAIRHARAQNISVSLKRVDSGLRLCVDDDGCGFNRDELRQPGLGLLSMNERMELVDGSLSIHSSPGSGTRICSRVPLDAEAERTGSSRSGGSF